MELCVHLRRGQEAVGHGDQRIRLGAFETNVSPEQEIHIVHHAGIYHGQRAPHAFLRRLEDQFNTSVQCVHIFF